MAKQVSCPADCSNADDVCNCVRDCCDEIEKCCAATGPGMKAFDINTVLPFIVTAAEAFLSFLKSKMPKTP